MKKKTDKKVCILYDAFYVKIPENAHCSIVTESGPVVLPRDGDEDGQERSEETNDQRE